MLNCLYRVTLFKRQIKIHYQKQIDENENILPSENPHKFYPKKALV